MIHVASSSAWRCCQEIKNKTCYFYFWFLRFCYYCCAFFSAWSQIIGFFSLQHLHRWPFFTYFIYDVEVDVFGFIFVSRRTVVLCNYWWIRYRIWNTCRDQREFPLTEMFWIKVLWDLYLFICLFICLSIYLSFLLSWRENVSENLARILKVCNVLEIFARVRKRSLTLALELFAIKRICRTRLPAWEPSTKPIDEPLRRAAGRLCLRGSAFMRASSLRRLRAGVVLRLLSIA